MSNLDPTEYRPETQVGAAQLGEQLARRIGVGQQPRMKLDATLPQPTPRTYEGLSHALVTHDPRLANAKPYVVIGGPGTGKTSLLIDAAVNFIRQGGKAEEIFFVAPSREAASAIRQEFFDRVASSGAFATEGTIVRSVHSWAFAMYRAVAIANGEPAPRLMTGAEHDMQIRTLLRGQVEDGLIAYWPEQLRAALPLVGFARQLRDLLLRAAERGVDGQALEELGNLHQHSLWQAAGVFQQQYEQVQRLANNVNVNASELLHATLQAIASPEGSALHQQHRDSISLILVDDAQNLDPAAAQFVQSYMHQRARVIVAGDPDQCVFHFRGANESFLLDLADQAADSDEQYLLELSSSHRVPDGVAQAVNALRKRLPRQAHRIPLSIASPAGSVECQDASPVGLEVQIAPNRTAERMAIVQHLLTTHRNTGAAWSDIAVIVRSAQQIPQLRRAMLNYGVPVKIDSSAVILAEQPLVRLLLIAMESALTDLSFEQLTTLMESVVGGADPVMLRRLRQRLAGIATTHEQWLGVSPDELLYHLVLQPQQRSTIAPADLAEVRAMLNPRELQVLHRITSITEAARNAVAGGHSVEMVLWHIWQATDLSTHLQWRALKGGTAGAQADEDLDAVMNLFDLAGDFVERNPQASAATFIAEVRSQELPTGTRERRGVTTNAVEILPAHAAAGRQWKHVVIANVQDDSWPAGATVGSLFGQTELVDLLDLGMDPSLPRATFEAALQEERRLFLLAISRATESTTVFAVKNTGEEALEPSRFIGEIGGLTQEQLDAKTLTSDPQEGNNDTGTETGFATVVSEHPRVSAIEPFIAELRGVLMNQEASEDERRAAGAVLARLADADLFGAAPETWWGSRNPSTNARLQNHHTLRISPSAVESILTCPLKRFLDSNGTIIGTTIYMKVGTIVHALADAMLHGMGLEEATDLLQRVYPLINEGTPQHQTKEIERLCTGLSKLNQWLQQQMAHGDQMLSELQVRTVITTEEGQPDVQVQGRIDLLIVNETGVAQVIDFKTSKTAKSKELAESDIQLRTYQYVVSRDLGYKPGGASLVYPMSNTVGTTVRVQAELLDSQIGELEELITRAATLSNGPTFQATPGSHCRQCDFHSICPAQQTSATVI